MGLAPISRVLQYLASSDSKGVVPFSVLGLIPHMLVLILLFLLGLLGNLLLLLQSLLVLNSRR